MARKVNPISVRLHLNRSSDPSRFSDYYHGKLMYQDVNPREYFGSIRPPTRKTFGFRLGRCIPHHSPKRTFIHLFPPRRPQLFLTRRGPARWRKGWSIGRLDPDISVLRSAPRGPLYRSGPSLMRMGGAGPYTNTRDRSGPIPRIRYMRRRSPSSGSHKCYLRGSGWLAPSRDWPLVSQSINKSSQSNRCFNFLLPRIRIHSRQNMGPSRLLQTTSSHYLVMQYSYQTENRTLYSLNHFALERGSRSAGSIAGHPQIRYIWPPNQYILRYKNIRYNSRGDKIYRFYNYILESESKSESESLLRDLDRSLLFPLLGATLLFLRENDNPIRSASKSDIYIWRLGQLGRALRNRLGGLVEKDIFLDLGGLMRRIGMMIGVIPNKRRIPYGYNSYLNEVRKMRSLLSGGTNANTSIGSVKIESVYQSASPIAQDISFQLRDGTRSFRSIFGRIVRDIPLVMPRVGGIRICCPGRLKGAEIARTECREYGKTSCNAFRHQIDYASAKVSTRYGILGVKVWIPFP